MSSPDASFEYPSPRAVPSVEPSPEPTLSAASSPARSTSSRADSLAGLSPSEVEQHALDLIFSDVAQVGVGVGVGGRLDAFDLPRPAIATLTRDQLDELELRANEFLAHSVSDAEADDWTYPTPRGFGPPGPLGLHTTSRLANDGDEGVGWDDKDGNGSDWIDRAFNLESYAAPEPELTHTMGHLDLAGPRSRMTTSIATAVTSHRDEEPELVEDWQGESAFADSVGDGGYSFAG